MLHTLIAACCLIMGHVHAPSGAPIAQAQIVIDGPKHAIATTDSKGDFSVDGPPGRYVVSASARGYAAVSVSTAIDADSHLDVVLEPGDSPKLRTIGQVNVNGGYSLNRNVIPEMDVTRQQMDAVGFESALDGLKQVPSAIIQYPDSGAPTAPAVVSLRGPDPSEALVTLDGQTLNDGNTGDLDISQFPVAAFNSINVTEGLGPTDSLGSNTFGGAVNFVTLQPTQAEHFTLAGSLGSYGTSQIFLNATGSIGKLGYAFAGSNFQQAGQVDANVFVTPSNYAPINCGTATKNNPENCPTLTHLGSTISSRLGSMNLVYNFSQRSDAGVRIFTLGNSRDESSAVNGIAGDPFIPCDPTDTSARCPASGNTAMPNPEYGQNVGLGESTFSQSIRAYDVYSRSVLGAGSLLADFYASDNNVDLVGGGAASPYDVSHLDKRYNESLSWGRTFDTSEFAFGGYTRQESLTGLGITQTLSQSIDSYYLRGAQQFGRNLRVSAGVYDADYSTFGNSVDWRLGASYDIDSSTVVRASAGTGFRAPLLIERYYFPEVIGPHGQVQPNPGLPPEDSNCVVAGQGNPDEKAEHATEYELGLSHLFSSQSNLDVSVYRSNLRDTIENFYPGFSCNAPTGSPTKFRSTSATPCTKAPKCASSKAFRSRTSRWFSPTASTSPSRFRSDRTFRTRPRAARSSTTSSSWASRSSKVRRFSYGRSEAGMRRRRLPSRATTTRSPTARTRKPTLPSESRSAGSTLRSPRRISSTRCPGRTRCTAAAYRIRGCTPPRAAARIPRTTSPINSISCRRRCASF